MWTRLTQMTGGLWLMLGLAFLGNEIGDLPSRDVRLGWMYYISFWGYLFLCIIAGTLLLARFSLGKWLVTLLAALLAVYALLIWGKADGAPMWFQAWCCGLLLFAFWSVYLVQRRTG